MIDLLIKIHDLPIKHPMEGISFHVVPDPVERLWWDGTHLEVVTSKGEVWELDFAEHRWKLTGTMHVEPLHQPPDEFGDIDCG